MLSQIWKVVSLQAFTRYRAVSLSLSVLWFIALALSLFGLVLPTPLELLGATVVLLFAAIGSELLARLITSRGLGFESAFITAMILSFVLRPAIELQSLLGLLLAGVFAIASKYLLRVNGRHIFNPAAFAVFVVLLTQLAGVAWWVASPAMLPGVLIIALLLVLRLRQSVMVATFVFVALLVTLLRDTIEGLSFGLGFMPGEVLWFALSASPVLFLGAFMLTEPATLAPFRWQRISVAVVAAVLFGGAFGSGVWFIGPDRALLLANLLSLLFSLLAATRRGFRAKVVANISLTRRVRELSLIAPRGFSFKAGQYLELEVPHPGADARGSRRELSIVSAPGDLPELKLAVTQHPDAEGKSSSLKRSLAQYQAEDWLALSGAWGDFTLPKDRTVPLLLLAGGIGITPFVSQLRQESLDREAGLSPREIVLIWAVRDQDQLGFDAEVFAAARVVVLGKDSVVIPDAWERSAAGRLSASDLEVIVPDLKKRAAYLSGSTAFVKSLKSELAAARSIQQDIFNGL